VTSADSCPAATFPFGGSQNNLNGLESTSLTSGGFNLQLSTRIPGTRLNEPQGAGLGIDSTTVVGAGDPQPPLFNVLEGGGPLAGTGEGARFSFDRSGLLTGINFDGVKDESLEYFVLETPGGQRYNFFDSAANTTVPGAVDSAIAAGVVTGQVVYLLEINSTIDDEAQGLQIPFGAGDPFTLTFQSLDSRFGPIEVANGARLQGITVLAVPEPAGYLLVSIGGLVSWKRRTRTPQWATINWSDGRSGGAPAR
jgi:hypothetical protein